MQTDLTITIASGALSEHIDNRKTFLGMLGTPASLAATTKISFKVCPTHDGTFLILRDRNGNRVELTVDLTDPYFYSLPEELFGANYFKIWTQNGSGVDVTQTTKSFIISLRG